MSYLYVIVSGIATVIISVFNVFGLVGDRMALSLQSHMVNSGPEVFYSRKWLQTVYEHIPYLKTLQATQIVQVTPEINYANQNNPVGILNDLRIPHENHYLISLINGWERSEYLDTITQVLIPPEDALSRLRKLLPAS